MAGPDRQSSPGVERRQSSRFSMQQQDDDDDYDLDAMGISDGFRPSNTMDSGHRRIASQTSQHTTYLPVRRATPPPRPSSATKPKALDCFALRHDGATGHVGGKSSMASSRSNAASTRSSSVSNDTATYVRFESPYHGPSGPSHPYQMYPQESRLARTASIATTSTVQARERSYNGPGGPTHPYEMYPQNTVPEAETRDDAPRAPPVAVGFPGSNNNYRRRLGPDGEEIADIIGPDGHTEQLPPYSQYPEEAFARKSLLTAAVPVAGAGGMGLATRNPEFASHEDLNHQQSRQSLQLALSVSPEIQMNNQETGISEKPELKKWQQVARRKLCSIVPIWAILLTACVFVVFGVVLGFVLVFLKHKHANDHRPSTSPEGEPQYQSVVYATLTTTFDATPLSTSPPGIPDLPTGTFALPISAPSSIENSCLVNTEQSKAWSCSIPLSPLQVKVLGLPGATNTLASNEVIIGYGNDSMQNCNPYGTQPPLLDDPQVLNLVVDTQEPGKGPAWFFQTTYNKVVVVPEHVLSYPSASKRNLLNRDNYDPDSLVAQPGDKPWFCYWNGTLLEAFLYVNLTSRAPVAGPAVVLPTATSSKPYSPSVTPAHSISVPSNPYSGRTWNEHGLLSAYPKVLKIQERRVPRGPQAIPPYCIQNIIATDGSAQQVVNRTGHPITIYLNETGLETAIPISPRSGFLYDESEQAVSKRQLSGSCGCVWLAT